MFSIEKPKGGGDRTIFRDIELRRANKLISDYLRNRVDKFPFDCHVENTFKTFADADEDRVTFKIDLVDFKFVYHEFNFSILWKSNLKEFYKDIGGNLDNIIEGLVDTD